METFAKDKEELEILSKKKTRVRISKNIRCISE